MTFDEIKKLLGGEAKKLLEHTSQTLPVNGLHLPGPDFLSRVWQPSDRSPQVLRSLGQLFNHGRLAGTGYLSLLAADQSVESCAGACFAANPIYFDPENLVRLALEGGCSAVMTSFGALGAVARRYAHRIPLIAKLNHDELLTYPNRMDQIRFGSVRRAWDLGAVAVGASIYFGSEQSRRQISEVATLFEEAHSLGMATLLLGGLRNEALDWGKKKDYQLAADLTGQANYLGASLQADLLFQKLPELNGGFKILAKADDPYFKIDVRLYALLASEHPIDLCRYQVANCFMGRAGLLSSSDSFGGSDLRKAIRGAIINKRAGGMGLVCGETAYQKSFKEGTLLLEAIQDVYLSEDVGIA